MSTIDLAQIAAPAWDAIVSYSHVLQEMQVSVLWLVGIVAFVVLVNVLAHSMRTTSREKGNEKMAREKRNAERRMVSTALYDTIFDLWFKDKISDATYYWVTHRLGDDADLRDFKPYKRIKATNHLHPDAIRQQLLELKQKLKGKHSRRKAGKTLDAPMNKSDPLAA
jgi:hypothetical protein